MKIKKKIEKIKEVPRITTDGTVSNPVADVDYTKAPSTTASIIKINSFSGDFGRVDINLLRDKVNEIIDFINKQ